MPTPTPNMGLQKPTEGNDTGVWGGYLNGDLDLLDQLALFPIQTFVQFGVSNLVPDAVSPIVFCFATTGNSDLSLNLPDAVSTTRKLFHLTKTDSGTGGAILNAVGGQTISGSTSYTLSNQFQFVGVFSDGSNWIVIINN